jgi:hypothetical protein
MKKRIRARKALERLLERIKKFFSKFKGKKK